MAAKKEESANAEAKKVFDPKTDSVFDVLYNTNVNDHTEKVEDDFGHSLTYLSWAWAWAAVKKIYPDAQYEVIKFDGIPYVFDPLTGYMVYTTVTINGITHEMWLPVMNSSNKAMKAEPYKYTTKKGEKTVAAATMFDINKTIMRCLTKNLAMFGLGLYIYAGEDLPEKDKADLKAEEEANQAEAAEKKIKERVKELRNLYSQTDGKDFDAWYVKNAPDGLTDKIYAQMAVTLKNQIKKKLEAEQKAQPEKKEETNE